MRLRDLVKVYSLVISLVEHGGGLPCLIYVNEAVLIPHKPCIRAIECINNERHYDQRFEPLRAVCSSVFSRTCVDIGDGRSALHRGILHSLVSNVPQVCNVL